MFAALLVKMTGAVVPAAAPRAWQESTTVSPRGVESATLDELISKLTRVDFSFVHDAKGDWYVRSSAVAELHDRIARGERPTDAQWQRILLASEAIHVRPKWPQGTPLAVFMSSPSWLGQAEIRATQLDRNQPQLHAGSIFASSGCGNDMIWRESQEQYQTLGSLPLGRHRITLDVELELGEDVMEGLYRLRPEKRPVPESPSIPVGILWHGPVNLDVEIVESIDGIVPPRADARLDAVLTEGACIRVWAREPAGSGWSASLVIEADAVRSPEIVETAFGLEWELWRGGQRLARTTSSLEPIFGLRPPADLGGDWPFSAILPLEKASGDPRDDPRMLAGLEVVIRGGTEEILRNWDATSRWDGEVRLRLSDLKRCSDD
jgi:hypothetical protein